MALTKLYYVYGLDTACLYNDEEYYYDRRICKARVTLDKIAKKKKELARLGKWDEHRQSYEHRESIVKQYIRKYKPELQKLLRANLNTVRTVRPDSIYTRTGERSLRKRVSIFESDLTRRFGLKEREFNTEIVIIKVFFFEVAESIIKNGFWMDGKKYIFFSSSAGQIRTKKLVAVREDLLKENWNSLTAGLTIDSINAQGGMNINKYIAYLALCNSATDLWQDFDIDRSIVVDDLETNIHGDVDYIDRDTYKITRTDMDVPVTHTDGCGMILPSLSQKNFMVRLPWTKGLLGVFDFVSFIKENGGNSVVTDIYGDKHDIIEENIQVIFTKSQLKMWKFFKSWDEYKTNFKKYGCSAGKCNVEEDTFCDATINYQMIQTLTDLSDDEILAISKRSADTIRGITSDKDCMLKAFGAVKTNADLNGFQKCLMKYPELLSDPYCRETLREIRKSREKDLWSAKMEINGKYTFLLPDLYAFCEYLFLGIKEPEGLLQNKEVYCRLFRAKELDCLRSPHLYIEHCVRNNVKGDQFGKWFITDAIYTSVHDLISKVMMFDNDGDKSLVVADKTVVEAAKRNAADVVPLYYEMAKAGAAQLNPDSIYEGLRLAYTGGNIGEISNAISKIWNSGEITQDKIDAVKLLVMDNNFVIDYAKTLFKPSPPDAVKEMIKGFTKGKLPNFFIYAKDKRPEQVEPASSSPVNRIRKLRPPRKLNFNFKNSNVGRFDYRMLMRDTNIAIDEKVTERFRELTAKLNFMIGDRERDSDYCALFDDIRNKMLELGYNEDDLADMLVKHLFYVKKTEKKRAFWIIFGDAVYNHICEKDFGKFVECKHCGKRFNPQRVTQVYCPHCTSHPRMGTKIITCRDCGIEIEVSSKDTRTVRCKDCQRITDREKTYIRVKKYREEKRV